MVTLLRTLCARVAISRGEGDRFGASTKSVESPRIRVLMLFPSGVAKTLAHTARFCATSAPVPSVVASMLALNWANCSSAAFFATSAVGVDE